MPQPTAMRTSLFGRLLALFLVVPLADLALLVWIGDRLGFWPTVGLIVATALAGSWLAKREGLAALRRFQARVASGQLPGRELSDGLIILVSGALLLTPGVLTDAVGLLGLLPPTRAWIRRRLEAKTRDLVASGRVGVFASGRATGAPPQRPTAAPMPPSSPPAGFEVIDATVVEEVEDPGLNARRSPGASS